MEIWKKCRNLGKNLEIWLKFGKFENIRKFGKKNEIWKKNWKFKNFFWKSGEKIGNLEKIWNFEKYSETIWKFGKHLKISKTKL